MIKFPFTTLQQLNLDWIMQQLKKILDFMPMNGSAGDVLQRNVDGAAWTPLPAVSMDIHLLNAADDISPADELPIYDASTQSNKKVTVTELLAGVDSPVTSVNGQTGDVVITIPDSTSDLVNDSGFVTAAQAASAAPVQSVNGQTGTVSLDAEDVGALPDSTRYADLAYTGGLKSLTMTVNPTLDANNDCVIEAAGVKYETSADKKTVRICGGAKINVGTNTGWRTFEITGLDVADFPDGMQYIHRDYSCTLYQDLQPARQICIAPTYTYVNYRVMADKTIHFYMSAESWMAGSTVYVIFNDIFQIP